MKPDEDKTELSSVPVQPVAEQPENIIDERLSDEAGDVSAIDDNSPEDGTEQTESLGKALYSWAGDLVGCLTFVVLFFIFVVRIIGVDGSSMEPTLHNSDLVLLLSNVLYDAQTDDIVVVYSESYGKPIVKRIIATEGQTVDFDFDSGQVTVDGQTLDEPYILESEYTPGDTQYPVTIPEGCVFVMGDNRNNSLDSRFSEIGIIDERSILGKVMFRIYPLNSVGTID